MSFMSLRRTLLAAVLVLMCATATATAQLAPKPGTAAIERHLSGGEAHRYAFAASAGQYVHVTVTQKGIDVVVLLTGPRGRVADIDSPNGPIGPEVLQAILDDAGDYSIEIRSFDPGADPGAYALRIDELRAATPAEIGSRSQFPGTPLGQLHRKIESLTRSINAQWGIYVKCIETGESVSINADVVADTMSVIKIPVMVELFRQAESGKLSLDEQVKLADSDKRIGSGLLQFMGAGAVLHLRDLAMMMIAVSDNTATDLIYRRIGGPEIVTASMRQMGFPTITASRTLDDYFKRVAAAGDLWQLHSRGETPLGLASARDLGTLLERLYRGEVVSRRASQQMLSILRTQVYNSRLPRHVPDIGAHKTGDFLPYIANDVGILELPTRHVVIAVLATRHNGNGATLEETIGRISELVAGYYAAR